MAPDLLWRALGICPGDVVVFTGDREKTALAQRVAEELAAEGRPPVWAGPGGPAGIPPAQAVAREPREDRVVLVEDEAGQGEVPAPDLVVPVIGQPAPAGRPGDPLQGLPALPPGARVVPVVTLSGGAATGAALAAARAAARSLLGRELPGGARVGRVVLADLRAPAPVRGVLGEAAALVLAGGAGRRFGANKLLHPWAGSTVLEASLRAPLRAGLKEVVVVTGAYHQELAPLLARYPVRVVPNPEWPEGMASSLRAGIRALVEEEAPAAGAALAGGEPGVGRQVPGAVVVCLGDMPFLPPAVVTELVRAWARTRAPVVAPVVGGARRNPVLFDRALLPLLRQVRGDEGGRSVVQRYREAMVQVPFSEEGWFRDVDGPADLG
ncbi:MAG: nucleotidyltransferase family protein [Bacillota bacterium]